MGHCHVGECGPTCGFSRNASHLGPRVSVINKADGKVLARIGDRPGQSVPRCETPAKPRAVLQQLIRME